MQDSQSNDNATSVLFPLFLCSIGINVLQHAWNSNELAVLQVADQQQQQKIVQLQTEKNICEGKFQGFVEGRR